MGRVIAGITTSVDGYVAGPNDGPGCGLGEGGERLHYWVFGGPWKYGDTEYGEMGPEDKAWMDEAMSGLGAVVGGRATYEAAEHWGDKNPWGVPFFIVPIVQRTSPVTSSPSWRASRTRSSGRVRRRGRRTCT